MSARRVVINADDLGLARGVNRGIAEALAAGVVRSTSLLVNMPATADAVRRLEQLRAARVDVGVGLHFNLVAGRSLTGARALDGPRRGSFHSLPAYLWRAWLRQLDLGAVAAELEAQLGRAQALLAPLGLRVTHIDSHRHTHALPGIAGVVRETARRHGIPHVRRSFEDGPTLLGRRGASLKAAALRLALGADEWPGDIRFAGIALMASPTFADDLLALCDALPPGDTEVMVHPGYDCAELAALDPYRSERERELRALTSPALAAALRARGIVPSHFGECATAPAA